MWFLLGFFGTQDPLYLGTGVWCFDQPYSTQLLFLVFLKLLTSLNHCRQRWPVNLYLTTELGLSYSQLY